MKSAARWKLAASMVIFGTLAPFVRRIPVGSGELALYRAILAAVLIGVYLLLSRQKLSLKEMRQEIRERITRA